MIKQWTTNQSGLESYPQFPFHSYVAAVIGSTSQDRTVSSWIFVFLFNFSLVRSTKSTYLVRSFLIPQFVRKLIQNMNNPQNRKHSSMMVCDIPKPSSSSRRWGAKDKQIKRLLDLSIVGVLLRYTQF